MEAIAKNVNEMTTAELKQFLSERESEEKKALALEKNKYEKDRDIFINQTMSQAVAIVEIVADFKRKLHEDMNLQDEKLKTYGKMNGKSRGGFSVTSSDGLTRIIRRRDTEPVWDERAIKGTELIKEFLFDTVKKRDQKVFSILISFIEKNDKGELEYAKVLGLLPHEDKFDDPRWVEGLRLIKESYSLSLKAFGYEFKTKKADGKWETLNLNFSSL